MRSVKKGPFIDGHLMEKINAATDAKAKKGHKDLVKKVNDSA